MGESMNTESTTDAPPSTEKVARGGSWVKPLVFLLLIAAIITAYGTLGGQATLDWLAAREASIRDLQERQPWAVYSAAFVVYVVITGLSLPGAAVMTLAMGWFFGWAPSLVLVSFASTAGATLAFLLSRYLFRESLQARFADRLRAFDAALEREGAFYLFTLRMVPAVPFFVINVVMGLTNLGVWTFWWVSQLGMLAGTAVFCYAGSRVPDLQTVASEGVNAAFTPEQTAQIFFAFTLLGLFPLIMKYLLRRFVPNATRVPTHE